MLFRSATYALHLLHLHPRAVALLAIFQHFCEGFAGVIPSVALFHHYFYPFVETEGAVSGCVDFRLRKEVNDDFFELGLKEEWGEWRHRWCFVHFPKFLDFFLEPTATAVSDDSWEDIDPQDGELRPAYDRIRSFRDQGLSGRHVVFDFASRCLAPLQQRSHPAWAFSGVHDQIGRAHV